MITFLKYISPMNYFLADSGGQARYWVDYQLLDADERGVLDEFDGSGSSYDKLDAAWQALNRGLIDDGWSKGLDLEKLDTLSLEEEYRFIKRFFSPIWFVYCYLLRLAMLKNPFRETKAFFKAAKSRRIDLFAKHREYPEFDSFESPLIESNPLVSVIIPTLNRYEYLNDVLRDLETQNYPHFEVIVVDQSEPVDEAFYKQFDLNLTLIYQEEKALWLARNTAVRILSGEYIAFSEDDVRIESDWIRQHLRCIDYFKADISNGPFYPQGSQLSKDQMIFRIANQFATGNALMKKRIFHHVGLFDRQFEKQRMGDGEFGLRCCLKGWHAINNPKASCVDIKAQSGGLRQMGSWDSFRSKKLMSPRPVPSVLYLCRRYFGRKAAVFMLLQSVPPSIVPYRFKRNRFLLVLGSLLSVVFLPFLFVQVWISWRHSSRMLAEGPKIETLATSS